MQQIINKLIKQYEFILMNLKLNDKNKNITNEEKEKYEFLSKSLLELNKNILNLPNIATELEKRDMTRNIILDNIELQKYTEYVDELNMYNKKKSKKHSYVVPKDKLLQIENSTVIIQVKKYLLERKKIIADKADNYYVLKNKIVLCEEIIKKLENLNLGIIDEELQNMINNFSKDTVYPISHAIKYQLQLLILKYNALVIKNSESNNLTSEKASKLLKEYNIDYDLLDEQTKDKISKLNYYKFKELLEFIKYNNIDINIHLMPMIVRTDKETFIEILKVVKENKLDIRNILNDLPSVFIKKDIKINNVVKTKRKPREKKKNNFSYTIEGSFEDFKENVESLKSLGFNITHCFNKCSSIFTISNKKLKRNIHDLALLGIDISSPNVDKINFPLTALKSSNLLFTTDQFIELNSLDYLMNNLSRLMLKPDDLIFYRLYYIEKYNYLNPHREIKKYNNKSLKGYITDPNNTELEVNKENCKEVTKLVKPVIISEQEDEEITNFIENINVWEYDKDILSDKIILELEQNYRASDSDLIYKFNTKNISRSKVLRLYSILRKEFKYDSKTLLLFATTYNSLIDIEEYSFIENCINNLNIGKER